MLISHKYKFIFIKTRKTAGTSIEVDLSQVMDDGDVVTKIFPEENGHTPRNYKFGNVECYNHMSGMEVMDVIGKNTFDSYFKFCVEREPVDKCISHHSMLNNSRFHNPNNRRVDWEEYLATGDFPVDDGKYTDKFGKLLVDKIVRYEKLNKELQDIFVMLSIPCRSICSRAKSGFREAAIAPSKISLTQRELIYKAFESSCVYTGYSLLGNA